MKKILGRTVGAGVAIIVTLLIQMDVFTIKMFTISGEESLKLGVIPILYDEGFNYNEAGERIVPGVPTVNDQADWKDGAVLDEYTNEITVFNLTRSTVRPGAELVMVPQGCVVATEGDGPSEALLGAEQALTEQNVDTIVYIPCPTDEVQVQQAREEIRQALDELYRAYFQQGNSGEQVTFRPRGPGPERTEQALRQQLDQRNYCEVDEDCAFFHGECPFGCWQMVNKQFVEPAQQLINDRREKEEKKGNFGCVYGCIQFAGVQCKEQKCITRTFLPSHASRPEKVDSADLERFRESPEDTREILQERRKIVDDYWNGVSYNQNCQLSDNGKYVICIETEESLSMNVPMGESTMTTLILTEAREKAFFE